MGRRRPSDHALFLAQLSGGEPEDYMEPERDIEEMAALLGGEIDGGKILCPDLGCVVVINGDGRPWVYSCSNGSVSATLKEVNKRLGTLPSLKVDRTDAAVKIWDETIPAAGTTVETYLRSRAITLLPPCVRYHPKLRHSPTGGLWPAMVASITSPSGGVCAVHRTYLRPSGEGQANLNPVKMTLGPIGGCAIRLAPVAPVMALAEGVETALSVMQATSIPTWSTISCVGMRGIVLPPGVEEITICADGEDAGADAAFAAARRLSKEGRKVKIASAGRGLDFNDLLMREARR